MIVISPQFVGKLYFSQILDSTQFLVHLIQSYDLSFLKVINNCDNMTDDNFIDMLKIS